MIHLGLVASESKVLKPDTNAKPSVSEIMHVAIYYCCKPNITINVNMETE